MLQRISISSCWINVYFILFPYTKLKLLFLKLSKTIKKFDVEFIDNILSFFQSLFLSVCHVLTKLHSSVSSSVLFRIHNKDVQYRVSVINDGDFFSSPCVALPLHCTVEFF